MYLAVHLVPLLLFKRKHLKEQYTLYLFSPTRELLKVLVNFCKSILFAGGYTALVRRTVCLVCANCKFVGGTFGSNCSIQHDRCYGCQHHFAVLTRQSTIIDSSIHFE